MYAIPAHIYNSLFMSRHTGEILTRRYLYVHMSPTKLTIFRGKKGKKTKRKGYTIIECNEPRELRNRS